MILLPVFLISACGTKLVQISSKSQLKIAQMPNKTTYETGEMLSFSGLKVVDKKTNEEIRDFESTPHEGYTFKQSDVGDYKVTISKEEYEPAYFTVKVSSSVSYTLSITHLPNKTTYSVGESFSLDGLVIFDNAIGINTSTYSTSIADGHTFTIDEVGTIEVVISKNGYESISFEITVSASLEHLLDEAKANSIAQLEQKYASFNLDLYDETGKSALLSVVEDYAEQINNTDSVEVINELLDAAFASLYEVPLSLGGKTITGIKVDSYPRKTIYSIGDKLDLDCLTVYLCFNDESQVKIDNYTVDDVNLSTAQKNVPITIRYQSFSTSFYIDVLAKPTTTQIVDIFATNDIHGQIQEQSDRASFGKLMTYLKDKSDDENTLLLDQGDTWQGSIYSNHNHGEMMTKVMNYVQYDARTIGNHDFDWGVDFIKHNSEIMNNGYRTPTLAANVYDYNFDTKVVGNKQQSSIGKTSVTYTLENGIKVGVVGTIGKDQITSINSLYTRDIAFVNHINIIKDEATKLRKDGCDIVISCTHCDQDDVLGFGLSEYVDLVLCGHSHQYEYTTEDGLLFAQYSAYSKYIGHIQMSYDPISKQVQYLDNDAISANDINASVSHSDDTIESIIDEYATRCETEAHQVVANNVYGNFYSSEQLPNLMCKAIYEEAVESGYTIDLAYTNNARASLYNSIWTYEDLYQAFPFDNVIYIIDVSYHEMVYEIAKYNYIYRSPDFDGVLSKDRTYHIACIDYLTFHTNSSRDYDYFSDNNGRYVGYLTDNYRLILKNYLISNGYNSGKSLESGDFSSSLTSFSRDFTN